MQRGEEGGKGGAAFDGLTSWVYAPEWEERKKKKGEEKGQESPREGEKKRGSREKVTLLFPLVFSWTGREGERRKKREKNLL